MLKIDASTIENKKLYGKRIAHEAFTSRFFWAQIIKYCLKIKFVQTKRLRIAREQERVFEPRIRQILGQRSNFEKSHRNDS